VSECPKCPLPSPSAGGPTPAGPLSPLGRVTEPLSSLPGTTDPHICYFFISTYIFENSKKKISIKIEKSPGAKVSPGGGLSEAEAHASREPISPHAKAGKLPKFRKIINRPKQLFAIIHLSQRIFKRAPVLLQILKTRSPARPKRRVAGRWPNPTGRRHARGAGRRAASRGHATHGRAAPATETWRGGLTTRA
jgi:hypothetical protein